MTHIVIAYHISLVNFQTNYGNNNILILDVKQLNKITKLCYFYTVKAQWDAQGKIKMNYRISRVKKQLSGKRSIPYKPGRNKKANENRQNPYLKVQLCRFENLSIYLCSCKNTILKVSHSES